MTTNRVEGKRTDEGVRGIESHFRTLVEQASDPFFLHDFNGRFVDANRTACESLGYSREELLQLGVVDVEQDFDLAAAQAVWRRIQPGETLMLQRHHRRKDGTIFPVEARISTSEIAGRQLFLGHVRDITESELAIEALRKSEAQYRRLFNAIDEGYCVIEMIYDGGSIPVDWRYLEVNPAFERHNGLRNAEGRRVLELVPNIEKKWFEIYGEVAASGRPVRLTQESPSLGRWFDILAFRVEGIGSRKVAVRFTDITERKLAEEALRESQQRITDFANTIPALAWVANADGWIAWYNQRWYQYTGTTPAQMEGWGWQSVHDPAALPKVMELWKRSIATGEPFEMVFPLKGADGVFRSFLTRVVPVRNTRGEIENWFGTNTDVDELRRAREELATAQDRIRIAMKSVPLLLYTVDRDLRYTWMPTTHPGFQVPDPIGRSGTELLEPEFARDLVDFKRSVLESGVSGRCEIRTVSNDNSRIWDIMAEPIRDETGKITGLTIAALDITARVNADEALRKSDKLALVGRLASTIAHEIRNPLDSVGNLLYMIESDDDMPRMRSYAQSAQEELARIGHIVTHTLQYNRPSIAVREEKLSALLESALTIYHGRIKHSGVEIRREYAASDSIFCFSSELRQVFANLIGNALDATRRGGTVTLRTHVHTHWLTGERGVRVTVADTGAGMNRKTLQRLFEPFFTTKGLEGTGLGLWVSREILDKHRAQVRVRSRQGPGNSGTTFSIWFPRAFPTGEPESTRS